MKNLVLCFAVVISFTLQAQIINPKETVKQKTSDRANNRIDQGIDKGLDKVEGLFKKKEKKPKQDKNNQNQNNNENDGSSNPNHTNPSTNNESNNSAQNGSGNVNIKAYSKFDFVAGEKVLYYDNFERVSVGDFPVDFNTNASGEVATIDGKEGKWLNMSKNGSFIPERMKALPDNFTLEFNAGIIEDPSNNMYGLGLIFGTNSKEIMTSGTGSFAYLHPGGATAYCNVNPENGNQIENNFKMPEWAVGENNSSKSFARISIWRQKGRLRLYVNESKIMDIPRFFTETKPYYFAFSRNFFNDCSLVISDLKFAVGQPDTRSKLITEGKLVTRGITFDVGSDRIKPESYGVLKEIAQVLAENPTVKVKIIGHTDSDGDATKNLDLSKKRANAISKALSDEFKIDALRMQTDGKGANEPSEPNTTPQGKANNRRVEFIKL
ncbi:MAG: OmpA family protein [Raineya sp.]|jgi:flagellar motor protein MotB|nr:OmpA family protein [Raineya sp.]